MEETFPPQNEPAGAANVTQGFPLTFRVSTDSLTPISLSVSGRQSRLPSECRQSIPRCGSVGIIHRAGNCVNDYCRPIPTYSNMQYQQLAAPRIPCRSVPRPTAAVARANAAPGTDYRLAAAYQADVFESVVMALRVKGELRAPWQAKLARSGGATLMMKTHTALSPLSPGIGRPPFAGWPGGFRVYPDLDSPGEAAVFETEHVPRHGFGGHASSPGPMVRISGKISCTAVANRFTYLFSSFSRRMAILQFRSGGEPAQAKSPMHPINRHFAADPLMQTWVLLSS
jgi:hypothetical protein